ncbi:MAG: hypothetical protein K2Q09_11055, partial [Phycisphaerales bacterium]|nr:hypothetical protein [Phycisphaerales bacterium]
GPAAGGVLESSGIEAVAVGVESMELPQAVTEAVFKSMQATQEKIAGAETKRGETEAASIRAKAEADAKKILAFSGRVSDVIRAQGDQESAQYLAMQKEDPRLAVFLQQLRFLRDTTSKRTTLVLPLSMAGFQLLNPRVQESLSKGIIPPVGVEEGTVPNVQAAPGAPEHRVIANQPGAGGQR